jgi:hypothetical protein
VLTPLCGNDGAIGFQTPQSGELGSAVFGQQIGIKLIRFRASGTAAMLHRFGVDRIRCLAGFEQRSHAQSMRGAR